MIETVQNSLYSNWNIDIYVSRSLCLYTQTEILTIHLLTYCANSHLLLQSLSWSTRCWIWFPCCRWSSWCEPSVWRTQRSNRRRRTTDPAARPTTRCWGFGRRKGLVQEEEEEEEEQCCTGPCCRSCWTNWGRCTWAGPPRSWRQSTAFSKSATRAKWNMKLMKPSIVLSRASKHSSWNGATTSSFTEHSTSCLTCERTRSNYWETDGQMCQEERLIDSFCTD